MKIAAVVVLAGVVVMASAFSIRRPVIVYYDGPERADEMGKFPPKDEPKRNIYALKTCITHYR